MDPSSNTPKSSRSKSRIPNPGLNAFRMDTPPPLFVPNPMFAQAQLNQAQLGFQIPSPQGYQMGYAQQGTQISPNLPTRVAYNEFRYTNPTPPPSFEFDQNDIRPDPDQMRDADESLDDIAEGVPETQPEAGGSRKTAQKGRAANEKWTVAEEIALAKSWLEISEDPVVGNSQKGSSFWLRITTFFHNEVGSTRRTHHQLNSKWRKMNQQITAFNGIFHKLWNKWKSGQSDVDIKKWPMNNIGCHIITTLFLSMRKMYFGQL